MGAVCGQRLAAGAEHGARHFEEGVADHDRDPDTDCNFHGVIVAAYQGTSKQKRFRPETGAAPSHKIGPLAVTAAQHMGFGQAKGAATFPGRRP